MSGKTFAVLLAAFFAAASVFCGTYSMSLARDASGLVMIACLVVFLFDRRHRRKSPPRATVVREEHGKYVCLRVTNEGETALFRALVTLRPPGILGSPVPNGVHGQWADVKGHRVTIESGASRLLRLVRLEGSLVNGRWNLQFTEDDTPREAPFRDWFIESGTPNATARWGATIEVSVLCDQRAAKGALEATVILMDGNISGGNAPPILVDEQLPRWTKHDS
jgi:hypothetical protein